MNLVYIIWLTIIKAVHCCTGYHVIYSTPLRHVFIEHSGGEIDWNALGEMAVKRVTDEVSTIHTSKTSTDQC